MEDSDMTRGRKPKPTAQRRLEGNPGRRPFNDDEPLPPPVDETFDAPPEELDGHVKAIAEWRRLVPLLRATRTITHADRAVLLALCLEWSRYLSATAEVRTKGMVIASPSGYPMVNPFVPIATKALAACTRLWPELGLTPSSRSRLKMVGGDAPPGDAFAEFDTPPPGARLN
jgi:P27 family predicted phage terminase small subunit